METTCQASYPLNSENASPPGTLTVYLSCWAKAKLPKRASNTATITVAGNAVLFMAHSCAAVCKSNFKTSVGPLTEKASRWPDPAAYQVRAGDQPQGLVLASDFRLRTVVLVVRNG